MPSSTVAMRTFVAFVGCCVANVAMGQTPSQKIDELICKPTANYREIASPVATDAEFLRRATLDLAGIVPSAMEAREFLGDRSPDKRMKLVDRLLSSEAFVRHWSIVLDGWLMDRRPGIHVKIPEWQEYLRTSLADGKPYDQLVREVLSSDGADPKHRAPARFFLDRAVEPNQLTKDIGRLFLGMNLHCAQCHDHPLVDGFKQEMYFGIYAFLNRSYLFTDPKEKRSMIAEKGEGDVTFQSVFKPKDTKQTKPKLPGGSAIAEPNIEKGKEYVRPVKTGERGVPTFSRKSQLADQIVGHPRFARATANRIWAALLGRGIVHPIEYDHDDNPPSHPELLDFLAAEFRDGKYDLKRFVRTIVLSETYQRSSELKNDGKAPESAVFAFATLRPLTPEQYAWSLLQATGQLDAERKAMGAKATPQALQAKFAGVVQPAIAMLAAPAGEPSFNEFEATLEQSLFVKNGKLLDGWLQPRPGNLTERTAATKSAKEAVEELYLSVLSRMPGADEAKESEALLQSAGQDRVAAIRSLAWALLASAEFRFNH
ncbi:MAG: DUF1553 domain-containing protein [Gemmataceae bacterium]